MFYTYVISSKIRNYVYIGLTSDVERRVEEHQKGYNKKTRVYGPFDLILFEIFKTRIDARKREKYLKSGAGKEWIKSNFLKKK